MVVRNFYVEADIDGRATTLRGGPASKEGEMTIHVHQREDGCILRDVVTVVCKEHDGVLTTTVLLDGKVQGKYESKR